MKRLVIVVVVLLAVLIGGDILAKSSAEARVAGVVQTNLELDERPEVSLGGFPFLYRMLGGHIPSMTAHAEDFTANGVAIQDLSVSLREIRFSAGELISGQGTIRAEDGDGTATLTGRAVTNALRDQGLLVTVRFSSGRVFVSSDQVPGEVEATVTLEGDTLMIRSQTPAVGQAVAMRLPQVVRGIRFTEADVRGSLAVVSFTLTDTSFNI